MATKKKVLMTLAVIMAFGIFGRQVLGVEDSNAPAAEKEKKAEKIRKVEHRAAAQRVRQRMAELSEQLSLSDEQKKTIRPIVENEIKAIQELRADASLAKEEKIEKMKLIRQKTQEEIKKILTPEQQKKLAEVKEEIREEAKEDVIQHVQHRMSVMSEKLNLTDEQKKKIEPIVENEIKEITAVKDDETASKEQKQEKMKAIRQKAQEEIKKILTPEQQRKLALEKEKGRGRITGKSNPSTRSGSRGEK